jgi:hypothetical protein
MAVLACERCGVKLSENSMKFHRQVCGSTQKPQCGHCGRRFDADALAVHEAVCGDKSTPAARPAAPSAVKPPPPETQKVESVSEPRSSVVNARDRATEVARQPPPRREEDMRKNLDQLREEIYGGKTASSAVAASTPVTEAQRRGDPFRSDRKAPQRQSSPEFVDDHPTTPPRSRGSSLNMPGRDQRLPAHPDAGLRDRSPPTPTAERRTYRGSTLDSGSTLGGLDEIRQASAEQERRIERIDRAVEHLRTDFDEIIRSQNRFREELDNLRQQKNSQASSAVAPRRDASSEEFRTDLHNLGRHVDALRDELDAIRAESVKHRRETDAAVATCNRTVSEHGDGLRILDAELHRLNEVVSRLASPENMTTSAVKQENLQITLEDLTQQMGSLTEEVDKLRREREAQLLLRRDVKYIGRDVDSMQDELKYLRRQVESDRRRVDQAVTSGVGNSTPRRVVNQQTSPMTTAVASPDHRPEYQHHRVARVPTPPATVTDFDGDTYVVGQPAATAHVESDTENIVSRAMSHRTSRVQVGSASRTHISTGYSSSRGSSVSSATGMAPVAHVHLAGGEPRNRRH